MSTVWNESLCQVFSWPECQNVEKNETRLLLRRQLETCVEKAWSDYKENYTWRSSLTHPHQLNNFKVNSIRIHLGRNKSDVKELKSFLGKEFNDVVSSPVRTIHIFARLDDDGLSCGLTIPAEAWWDFNRLNEELEHEKSDLLDYLKSEFPNGLAIAPSWINQEPICQLDLQTWHCLIKSIKAGQDFFQVKISNGFKEGIDDFLSDNIHSLDKLFENLKWQVK